MGLQLLGGELIGTAVAGLRNAAHGTGVDINGAVTQTLWLQGPEVAFVQRIESVLFAGLHDKLLLYRAR